MQDDLCKWLEEAVQKKPSEWKANDVKEFDTYILGNEDMKRKLIVRDCYVKMQVEAIKWLEARLNSESRTGLFVITGTPGIGKSIFLAYMAGVLAEKNYDIVIQRGQEWWSRAGGQIVAHGREEPLSFLKRAETVLLFDPLAGQWGAKLDYRSAGRTLVFTSPRRESYSTAWKQQIVNSDLRYLPCWTEEEVVKHSKAFFADYISEEQVREAYKLLGGNVRWLARLFAEKGDLTDKAHKLILDAVGRSTYENLRQALLSEASNMEKEHNQMSLLLQIHSEYPFSDGKRLLIESDLAHNTIREKLDQQGREARQQFINAALDTKELGSFVGDLFQDEVLKKLTGSSPLALEVASLPDKIQQKIQVPCRLQNLPKKEKQDKGFGHIKFESNLLYNPQIKNFPATDIFFLQEQDGKFVLWLLQITKASRHDCKLGSMQKKFKEYFSEDDLKKINSLRLVVVAPAGIANKYAAPLKIEDGWMQEGIDLKPDQYVSSWKW